MRLLTLNNYQEELRNLLSELPLIQKDKIFLYNELKDSVQFMVTESQILIPNLFDSISGLLAILHISNYFDWKYKNDFTQVVDDKEFILFN